MTALPAFPPFDSRRLEFVFNQCFADTENTQLRGGAEEPLYQPAIGSGGVHLLFYREDYFASALHEIAHWCIAGRARRQQLDFGYWYAPEGRTPAQQRAFEAVESRPQALEWILAQACRYHFRISADNFLADGTLPDTSAFCQQVVERAQQFQREGLPRRAQQLFSALCCEFGHAVQLETMVFRARDIH